MATPVDVAHVRDLTPEHLGGATPRELAAFRMAALQTVLHFEVAERVALLLVYGDGTDWRETVAAAVPLQWGLVTGEVDLHPGTGGPPASRPTCTRPEEADPGRA